MLDYRMITQSKFEKKNSLFDPNRTFKNIIEMFKDQAQAKGIELSHYVAGYLRSPNVHTQNDEEEQILLTPSDRPMNRS